MYEINVARKAFVSTCKFRYQIVSCEVWYDSDGTSERDNIPHCFKGMTIKGNDVTTMKAVDVLNLCAKRQAHKRGFPRKGRVNAGKTYVDMLLTCCCKGWML